VRRLTDRTPAPSPSEGGEGNARDTLHVSQGVERKSHGVWFVERGESNKNSPFAHPATAPG